MLCGARFVTGVGTGGTAAWMLTVDVQSGWRAQP